MKNSIIAFLFSLLFMPLTMAMSASEMDAKLRTRKIPDLASVSTYLHVIRITPDKADAAEKISLAKVLYKYRNEPTQNFTLGPNSDEVFVRGRGWAASWMMELVVSADQEVVPAYFKNQTNSRGFKMPPEFLVQTYPEAQERFFDWFAKEFLQADSKSARGANLMDHGRSQNSASGERTQIESQEILARNVTKNFTHHWSVWPIVVVSSIILVGIAGLFVFKRASKQSTRH